jgi:hypothetical protein
MEKHARKIPDTTEYGRQAINNTQYGTNQSLTPSTKGNSFEVAKQLN